MKYANRSGFTLVEVLVSLAIFALIATVILTSMLQLTRVDSGSRNKTSSDLQAQQVTEQVKTAWRSSLDYSRNCVTDLSLPDGATVTSQPLSVTLNPSAVSVLTDAAGTPIAAANVTACTGTSAATSPVPVMRRLKVRTTSGSKTTEVVLDILAPQGSV